MNDDVDNVGNRTVTVTGAASNGQAAANSETMAVTGAMLTLTDDEETPGGDVEAVVFVDLWRPAGWRR